MTSDTRKTAHAAPQWVARIGLMLLVLGPLYWVTASSFKGREEILRSTPTLFPESFTLDNFRQLLTATDYGTYLFNSMVVALLTAAGTVAVSFLGSYGLYRLRIPWGNKIAGLVLLAYMIPGTLLLVPVYQMFARLGIVDTRTALVLVNIAFAAPFCTWLLRGFLQAVPRELDEAAAIDGCGPVRTMLSVVLPLMLPGLATVAVYAFVYSWTEFVFASQLVVSEELKTLPIGLSAIMGQYTVNWGLLMAGTVFTMIPAIIPFLFVGKYFIGGLTSGAVK
jgi:ABC-type glycerol-3-phosphate transport system permease component